MSERVTYYPDGTVRERCNIVDDQLEGGLSPARDAKRQVAPLAHAPT